MASGQEGQQKLLNVQCTGLQLIPLFLMMLHFRFAPLTACWLLPVLCFSIFITHSNLMLPEWEERFPLWTKEKTQLSDFCYMSLIFREIS